MRVMLIDLHAHSFVSDGTQSPADLVAQAGASGVGVLALTDHDTFDGLPEATGAAAACGVEVLGGVEISAQFAGQSVHLLGYGCRTDDQALLGELARIREGRLQRLPTMLARLASVGMPLSVDQVSAFSGDASSVGRPHVADALVAAGYVRDRDEAFVRWLADDKPCYVPRYAPELADAIAAVREASGVAVLAHAWSKRGRHTLPERVLAEFVTEHGLDGIECDHPDHLPAERATLHALAGRLGVLVTGSSDYHGAGKKAGYALGACGTASEMYERLGGLIAERGGEPPVR